MVGGGVAGGRGGDGGGASGEGGIVYCTHVSIASLGCAVATTMKYATVASAAVGSSGSVATAHGAPTKPYT